jgi:hypothetical protein
MKRYMSFLINVVLVLATFIVSVFIITEPFNVNGDEAIPYAIALTILIIFVYRKIATKFNL